MVSALKYVNVGAGLGLCLLVYQTQKKIWELDMGYKHRGNDV